MCIIWKYEIVIKLNKYNLYDTLKIYIPADLVR